VLPALGFAQEVDILDVCILLRLLCLPLRRDGGKTLRLASAPLNFDFMITVPSGINPATLTEPTEGISPLLQPLLLPTAGKVP